MGGWFSCGRAALQKGGNVSQSVALIRGWLGLGGWDVANKENGRTTRDSSWAGSSGRERMGRACCAGGGSVGSVDEEMKKGRRVGGAVGSFDDGGLQVRQAGRCLAAAVLSWRCLALSADRLDTLQWLVEAADRSRGGGACL